MDSIPEQERCTCTPETTAHGKQYPPKMGEGRARKSEQQQPVVGLAGSSANLGVDSAVDGISGSAE